ncbi:hypothetical protein ACF0H5_022863 [Mactra antiquata]
MPTSQLELRASNTLPDIFQTLSGSNLDIGMFDHLRNGDSQRNQDNGPLWGNGANTKKESAEKINFPRIVLRDALGHELDTFTTLQEAIYRAKWNVAQTGQAKFPIEWRLPKAPPPARPDLTRTFPPVKHPPTGLADARSRAKWESSKVLEFDVEDVGFVRESLQYLPYAPSLSFLRQEILGGPKTYFQIVGTMLLHNKILSQTEKRKAIYNFPGFCTGCIRMGICYGCERSSEVHFHEDKPVKTGGGFTYFKKDRPEREIHSKNPINWKVKHPDRTLKKLMEEYGGVELDGKIPHEIKRHLDEHGGTREQIITLDHHGNDQNGDSNKRKTKLHVTYDLDNKNGYYDNDLEGEDQGHRKQNVDLNDVRVEIDDDDDDISGNDSDDEINDINNLNNMRSKSDGTKLRVVTRKKHRSLSNERSRSEDDNISSRMKRGSLSAKGDDRESMYDIQNMMTSSGDDRESMYDIQNMMTSSDEENIDGSVTDGSPGRKSRKRDKLYKPPPPFKLKKSPKRSIEARSPFSTNRSFDLPKGKGVDIKKSDKKPTQFKEFKKGDAGWKEPKKFELKKTDNKTTKFWSAPVKKQEEDKRSRRRTGDSGNNGNRFRRVPSPRSVSPDSGLESELNTDTGTNRSELEPVREETLTPEPDMGKFLQLSPFVAS